MTRPFIQTDIYKLGHHAQYPEGTEVVYSNFTPRSNKHSNGVNEVVVFGVQAAFNQMIEDWKANFFDVKWYIIEYEMDHYFNSVCPGPSNADLIKKFKYLHSLGYLPINVMALPEGTVVKHGTPIFTYWNTDHNCYWLTNYLETYLSCMIWKPLTSASTAFFLKRILDTYAEKTCDNNLHVEFQAHDFSNRGMSNALDAQMSGAGHLLSFNGTDTISAVQWVEDWYKETPIALSVPATEHSVMCANIELGVQLDKSGAEDSVLRANSERAFIKKLVTELYPNGIVSIVSDTFDFWRVIKDILPTLKDDIMARDGKTVVRPDCCSSDTEILTESGWKYFKDLVETDKVAQVFDDGHYEFVKPNKIIKQNYNGPMYHIYDHYGKIDLLVTPNHRLVVNHRIKGDMIVEAENFKHGNWDYRKYRSASAKLSTKKLSNFERFLIALQADGSIKYIGNKTVRVEFNFSKQRKIEKLSALLESLKSEGVSYTQSKLKNGQDIFYVNIPKKYTISKYFNWVDLANLTKEWCQEFIEELSNWDSCVRNDGRIKYDSTIKDNISIVEIIAVSAGYGVLISSYEDNRKNHFNDVYTAHIMKNNIIGGQSLSKDEIQYNDYVYCVNVDTGKLLVKRNRGICVSGNSGDPANVICGSVPIIDLDFVNKPCNFDIQEHDIKDYLYDILEDNMYADDGSNYGDTIYMFGVKTNSCYFKLGDTYYRFDIEIEGFNDYYQFSIEKFESVKYEDIPAEHKGVVRCLWDTFGGEINSKGCKVLDTHIGAIYGDSITPALADNILARLAISGFASSNIVFGVGSYTYNCVTRDTHGCAIKATGLIVNGMEVALYKAPKGDKSKHSLRGFINMYYGKVYDNLSFSEATNLRRSDYKLLVSNGKMNFAKKWNEIRERLHSHVS